MHQCQTSASILIVEDDQSTIKLLSKMLIGCGHKIVGTAESGEEAITLTERSKPQLVLMDIGLKGKIDGITATTYIKKNFDIPVIYITGGIEDPDFERVKESMPYGFILKPIDNNMLIHCIDLALYRFQTEKRLREVEERNADILAADPDVIFYVNSEGRFYNVAERERAGKNWPDQIARRALPLVQKVLASGNPQAFEFAVKRQGHVVYYESRILKSRSDRALVMIRDISDRKKFERELTDYRENLEKRVKERTRALSETNSELNSEIQKREKTEQSLKIFRHAMNQSPYLVIILTASGEVEYANQRFSDISGYSLDQIVGQNVSKPGNRILPEPELWTQMTSSMSWRGEVYSLNAGGELYYTLGTISSITEEDGSVANYIYQGEDITESKKQEMEIDRVRELMDGSRLDEVDIQMDWRDWQEKMMNRNISRTDKSLFRNINNSFTQGAGFGALISLLEIMKSSAERQGENYLIKASLYELIESNVAIAQAAFKTFSNIDWIISNEFEMTSMSFREFYDFSKLVIADAEKYTSVKNQKIILNSFPAEFADYTILMNREYLYKVIYESLINAMKFSRQRTFITVFVSVVGRHVSISFVNDPEKGEEGLTGIPPEYEKVIFEPFFRLSKLVFESFHTLDFGLGLTLVEKIISKHGGEVFMRNIVDHSDLKREAQVKVNLTISLPLEITT